MSPTILRVLRTVELDTRRLANRPDSTGARYPRDYYRPAALFGP